MSVPANDRPRVKLKTLDELFLLDEEHQAQDELAKKSIESKMIPIDKLIPFSNHPFRLYEGERLDDMVDSIINNGVLVPIIARTTENGMLEILAGHNRANAAKLAGHDKVPVFIKENIDDEKAMIYVIETNVMQRSFTDFSHSEKAAVLSMQYSKMFSEGKRNEIINELNALSNPLDSKENLSHSQVANKPSTMQIVGDGYDLSKDTVARYLRVNQLISPLKVMLDISRIAFIPAVMLSFLTDSEQEYVRKCIELNEFKLDIKKAGLLRSYSERGNLDEDNIYLILSGEKNRKPRARAVPYTMKKKTYAKYFSPSQKLDEIDKIVDEALAAYFRNRNQEHTFSHANDNTLVEDEQEDELEQ